MPSLNQAIALDSSILSRQCEDECYDTNWFWSDNYSADWNCSFLPGMRRVYVKRDEALKLHLKAIGKVPGNEVVFMAVEEKEGKSFRIPHKCIIKDDYSFHIIPQQTILENGKPKREGGKYYWKDAGVGFCLKNNISYFNEVVKFGKYTNVYFKPNSLKGGLGKTNFDSAKCLFMESDAASPGEQLEIAAWFQKITGLNFSAVIFSGGKSYHLYISLNSPIANCEHWEYLQKLFCALLRGDPAITNADREMRPAGSIRRKKDGSTAECALEYVSDASYSPEYVTERLEDAFLEVYGVDPKMLLPTEWLQKWRKIVPALKGKTTAEEIKALLNEPTPTQTDKKPLSPEAKTEVKDCITKRNGENYPFINFLSKSCKDDLRSPILLHTFHNTLFSISTRIHQAKDACETYGIPFDEEEPYALFLQAAGNYEGEASEGEIQREWEQGAIKASQYPYPGGEDRLLRVVAYTDGIKGYEEEPNYSLEDSEKTEEEIKAERKVKEDALYAELITLGKLNLPNVRYIYTNYDRHNYHKTRELLKNDKNKKQHFVLIAQPGLGKTQLIKGEAQKSNNTVVVVPLNSLQLGFANDEWRCDLHKGDYKYTKDNLYREAITYKSASHIAIPCLAERNSLLFLDEFKDALSQLFPPLFSSDKPFFSPEERMATIAALKNAIETVALSGNLGVSASADFTDRDIKLLRGLLSEEIELVVIIDTFIPERDEIKLYTGNANSFFLKRDEALLENWNWQSNSFEGAILTMSDHKHGAKGSSTSAKVDELVNNEWKRFVLDISADTKYTEKVQKFFLNPNEEVKKYFSVTASNALKNGVNLNNGWIVAIFCCESGLTSSRDVLQKIMRERTCTDIHLWIAEKSNNNSDCPYVDPQHVRNFYSGRKRKEDERRTAFFNSFNLKYQPSTEDFDSPEFTFWCEEVAFKNLEGRDLRRRIKEHLEKNGYTIKECTTDYSKEAEKARKSKCEAIDFERMLFHSLNTANAIELDHVQVEALKDDPEYKAAVDKFFLLKKCPPKFIEEIEPLVLKHPLTEEEITLEGLAVAAWYQNKERLFDKFKVAFETFYTDEKFCIEEDIQKEVSTRVKAREALSGFGGTKPKPLGKKASKNLMMGTLRDLGIVDLFENLDPGTDPQKQQEIISAFISKLLALKDKGKQELGITLKTTKRPKTILDQLFDNKFGLPLVDEQVRCGEKRLYRYFIESEHALMFAQYSDAVRGEYTKRGGFTLEYLLEQTKNS